MKNLIEILKKETESLKIQYVEMTEKWAIKEFDNLRQWANDYQKGKFGFREASKKYYRLPHYIVNSNGKAEQHVEKMVKNAIEHYELSIEKLAARIEKKGLNQENLKTVTSHIGVNIETTLTDGNKTVRAFTIIAEIDLKEFKSRFAMEYGYIQYSLSDKEIKHFISKLKCSMEKALDLFQDYILANGLADDVQL